MMKTVITKNQEETLSLARKIAGSLKPGDVIALNGDLGAGKTVFVKGIAQGLGIERSVLSPTFTIVREYRESRIPLFHFDVYRTESSDEMFEIGFSEYLYGNGICVIEWADLISDILPDNILRITIEYLGENERKITLSSDDPRWEELTL